jgi:hypothetical protein
MCTQSMYSLQKLTYTAAEEALLGIFSIDLLPLLLSLPPPLLHMDLDQSLCTRRVIQLIQCAAHPGKPA